MGRGSEDTDDMLVHRGCIINSLKPKVHVYICIYIYIYLKIQFVPQIKLAASSLKSHMGLC